MECEKIDETHQAVFPSCKGDVQFVEDLEVPNKYHLEYFEELGSHVDLIDAGQWNVGLKHSFCSIEKNRLFFKDQYSPLRIDSITVTLPVFNGNVNGGTYAIAELSFNFLETGDVQVEFDSKAYRLNLSEGGWTLVDYLEIICIIFALELFFRAVLEIRREGFHLRNSVTIFSSIFYLLITLLNLVIHEYSSDFDLDAILDADPLGGGDKFTNLVVALSDFVWMKWLYSAFEVSAMRNRERNCRMDLPLLCVTLQLSRFSHYSRPASLFPLQFMNVAFSVIGLLRCFLILSFHKRLSILTETLWTGLVDIYHWVVVLGMFTTVFSTVFHYMLGTQNEVSRRGAEARGR